MLASLNKVLLIGCLGNDPDVKDLKNGGLITTFSLATNRYSKDREPQTEWHRVKAFGKAAENLAKYTNKGSQLYVEGHLQTSDWQDQNGRHERTEIIVDSFQFLSSRQSSQSSQATQKQERLEQKPTKKQPPPRAEDWPDDDDIPF